MLVDRTIIVDPVIVHIEWVTVHPASRHDTAAHVHGETAMVFRRVGAQARWLVGSMEELVLAVSIDQRLLSLLGAEIVIAQRAIRVAQTTATA